MSGVFSMIYPVQRGFVYDPADGAELVSSKIAVLLLNTFASAPTDAAIDENGVLTCTPAQGGTFIANPGDYISGANGYFFNDGAEPPYAGYGLILIGPYDPLLQ